MVQAESKYVFRGPAPFVGIDGFDDDTDDDLIPEEEPGDGDPEDPEDPGLPTLPSTPTNGPEYLPYIDPNNNFQRVKFVGACAGGWDSSPAQTWNWRQFIYGGSLAFQGNSAFGPSKRDHGPFFFFFYHQDLPVEQRVISFEIAHFNRYRLQGYRSSESAPNYRRWWYGIWETRNPTGGEPVDGNYSNSNGLTCYIMRLGTFSNVRQFCSEGDYLIRTGWTQYPATLEPANPTGPNQWSWLGYSGTTRWIHHILDTTSLVSGNWYVIKPHVGLQTNNAIIYKSVVVPWRNQHSWWRIRLPQAGTHTLFEEGAPFDQKNIIFNGYRGVTNNTFQISEIGGVQYGEAIIVKNGETPTRFYMNSGMATKGNSPMVCVAMGDGRIDFFDSAGLPVSGGPSFLNHRMSTMFFNLPDGAISFQVAVDSQHDVMLYGFYVLANINPEGDRTLLANEENVQGVNMRNRTVNTPDADDMGGLEPWWDPNLSPAASLTGHNIPFPYAPPPYTP